MIVQQFTLRRPRQILAGCERLGAEVAGGTTRGPGAIPLDFANTHARVVQNRLSSQGVVGSRS